MYGKTNSSDRFTFVAFTPQGREHSRVRANLVVGEPLLFYFRSASYQQCYDLVMLSLASGRRIEATVDRPSEGSGIL